MRQQVMMVVISCAFLEAGCSAPGGETTDQVEASRAVGDEAATPDSGQNPVAGESSLAPHPSGLCRPTSREPGMEPTEEGGAGPIRRVAIRVVPADGGMAQRAVEPDGRVNGGHLSGDPGHPMVTQEHGRVSGECVSAVWEAAARVVAATRGAEQPPASSDAGTTTLTITVEGADAVQVQWAFREGASLDEVRTLVGLLQEMEIGYW